LIFVCSLPELNRHAAALRPARLISIIGEAEQPDTPPGLAAGRHLRVACDDITAPVPAAVVPDRRHVKQIIAFARQWDPETPLLVHCRAGISRSTATALIAHAAHFPEVVEVAFAHLCRVAPYAQPNALIVRYGDELLGLGGRLVAAREAMADVEPALEGSLVNIPHPRELAPGGGPAPAARRNTAG